MGADAGITAAMAAACKAAGQAQTAGGVIKFCLEMFGSEEMKTFNETKWMPGKVVIQKAKYGGTEAKVEKPNQKGNASVFIYAKDSKGYVEIELTATKATVLLSWVVDTFDKDGGRCMVDLKDMLL